MTIPTHPEPSPSAGATAHAAWKRAAARSFAQHLQHRNDGGPSRSALERRFGVRWERLEAIAWEFGIGVKPAKRKERRAC
jgi:hypothetical protein